MRNIISEIRKSLYLPLFMLSCFGVVLVCCFSGGYISASGKTYTIMELLLFLRRDVMLTDVFLNRYEIWVQGIGLWTQLLLPFLISIGYLYTISNEKMSGFNRLLLIRESNFRYVISKLAAAVLSGGIILSVGYLFFGILVYIKFPSIYEYSVEQQEFYMAMHPGFQETTFCFRRCIGIFLYGMCINVFAYLVSVFFRDKYILICLPLMLKYIWGQVVMKIEIDAMNKGKDAVLNLCSGLRMESVLNINQSGYWGMALFLIFLIYLAGFCLTLHFLKKRGEEFGFE